MPLKSMDILPATAGPGFFYYFICLRKFFSSSLKGKTDMEYHTVLYEHYAKK